MGHEKWVLVRWTSWGNTITSQDERELDFAIYEKIFPNYMFGNLNTWIKVIVDGQVCIERNIVSDPLSHLTHIMNYFPFL